MEKTTIEIVEIIDKGEKISSRTNKPYLLAKIKDGRTGRIGRAMGEWTRGWKLGDTIEGIWKENDYQGTKSWNIEDPNQKPFTGRRGGGFNLGLEAWKVAGQIAPVVFSHLLGKKQIKLGDVKKLSDAILEELQKTQPKPAEPKPAEKSEESPKKTEVEPEEEEVEGDEEERLF